MHMMLQRENEFKMKLINKKLSEKNKKNFNNKEKL